MKRLCFLLCACLALPTLAVAKPHGRCVRVTSATVLQGPAGIIAYLEPGSYLPVGSRRSAERIGVSYPGVGAAWVPSHAVSLGPCPAFGQRRRDPRLVALWHASASVGSGYDTIMTLAANGSAVRFANQMDAGLRWRAQIGRWGVLNGTLYLALMAEVRIVGGRRSTQGCGPSETRCIIGGREQIFVYRSPIWRALGAVRYPKRAPQPGSGLPGLHVGQQQYWVGAIQFGKSHRLLVRKLLDKLRHTGQSLATPL